MVECPSKKIDSTIVDISKNHGAICMPYYGYRGAKSNFKYNGPNSLGRDYEYLWDDNYQCLAKDCVTMLSKAACAADPSLECICYDTCKDNMGATFFPFFDEWLETPSTTAN